MAKIFDFQRARSEKIEHKRRNFERVLFKNFMGSYSVLDRAGSLYQIEMVDISETGCLFQVPWTSGSKQRFELDSEINLRMYFTKSQFLPIIIKIKYAKDFVDDKGNAIVQYGCEFDQSIQTYQALKSLVHFLYQFAELSVDDQGKSRQVFHL